MPKVSVIVPNYNHARYLPKRIESVLGQTFDDFEVVLLDDCSTDQSRTILNGYAAHPRVSGLHFNERNSGSPFLQWEKGVHIASGTYIWIAESDDWADPHFLERLVPLLDEDETVGLAYCRSHRVDEEGNTFDLWLPRGHGFDPSRWEQDFRCPGRVELAERLCLTNTIPNASAVVARRDLLLAAFREGRVTLRAGGDLMIWGRLLMQSDMAYCSDPLNYFRCHDRSVRATIDDVRHLYERLQWLAYLCKRLKIASEARGRMVSMLMGRWNTMAHVSSLRAAPSGMSKVFLQAFRVDTSLPLRMMCLFMLNVSIGLQSKARARLLH